MISSTSSSTTSEETESAAVTVIASMRARPDRRSELRAVLVSLIEPTRADDGMISYALYEDADDPDQFWFVEVWDSAASLERHLDQPHLEALTAREAELVDDAGIRVQRLRLLDRC